MSSFHERGLTERDFSGRKGVLHSGSDAARTYSCAGGVIVSRRVGVSRKVIFSTITYSLPNRYLRLTY